MGKTECVIKMRKPQRRKGTSVDVAPLLARATETAPEASNDDAPVQMIARPRGSAGLGSIKRSVYAASRAFRDESTNPLFRVGDAAEVDSGGGTLACNWNDTIISSRATIAAHGSVVDVVSLTQPFFLLLHHATGLAGVPLVPQVSWEWRKTPC